LLWDLFESSNGWETLNQQNKFASSVWQRFEATEEGADILL